MSSFQSAAAGIFQLLCKRPTAMNWTTFNLLDVGVMSDGVLLPTFYTDS